MWSIYIKGFSSTSMVCFHSPSYRLVCVGVQQVPVATPGTWRKWEPLNENILCLRMKPKDKSMNSFSWCSFWPFSAIGHCVSQRGLCPEVCSCRGPPHQWRLKWCHHWLKYPLKSVADGWYHIHTRIGWLQKVKDGCLPFSLDFQSDCLCPKLWVYPGGLEWFLCTFGSAWKVATWGEAGMNKLP